LQLELESLEPRVLFDRSAGSPYLVPQHYLMVSNGYLTAPKVEIAGAGARLCGNACR